MKNKKHIVKSEICNERGAWSKEALAFGKDIDDAFDKIMEKHKGKLSIDAMSFCAYTSINLRAYYHKAMEAVY